MTSHAEHLWIVSAIESDRIVLTGGDTARTISALRSAGRRALIFIGMDLKRFVFAPTDEIDLSETPDLTVIEENGALIITRPKIRDAFGQRSDDEILGKRAIFYRLFLKEDARGYSQELIELP